MADTEDTEPGPGEGSGQCRGRQAGPVQCRHSTTLLQQHTTSDNIADMVTEATKVTLWPQEGLSTPIPRP